MAETITRAQLTEAIYQEVGLSRNESADLVESVLSEVSDALIKGEMVKISSFGSFSVRHKNKRMGRNPKTGQEALISARKVVIFKASKQLKQKINTISGDNIALTLQNNFYQDSLNTLILESNINNNKHNKSLRHLSTSLRFL